MEEFTVKTSAQNELIDITGRISSIVANAGVTNGMCLVYTPHTTAAITINENADPDVKSDLLRGLDSLNFEKVPFRHMEGNSPGHLKSSIFGCSEHIIVQNGELVLGTWQGIYFCEFDGPRIRKVFVTLSGSPDA